MFWPFLFSGTLWHSVFTFDVCWGSLGTSIWGHSSSIANNTQSRLPSRLSFRFFWLCSHWFFSRPLQLPQEWTEKSWNCFWAFIYFCTEYIFEMAQNKLVNNKYGQHLMVFKQTLGIQKKLVVIPTLLFSSSLITN